ncbi:MAG: DNA helicase RecQ [Chitinispirillales bacterium]|jgi:ATP-dependent DNA helicase RecQ|nr:DNA helicase RecQ [Chitinispirillales bacterium]
MTSLEVLKRYFGYDNFRSGQQTLIDSILAGKDVLGVMPTGAGKSICFQIPSLMMSGLTIVVSPLISLMKDQVNSLTQSGVSAAFINSSLTERQIYKALENAESGIYRLIYAAPERLLTPDFSEFAKSAPISMLTVDEAHCISQWGQDFRPSYAKIPEFIEKLPNRPVLSAFTATATSRVREDIIDLLRLNDPEVLVTGFDRRNLYFEVQKPNDKYASLTAFLSDKKDRYGIVYCSTRAAVEEVCENLQSDGYSASRYHAGLTDSERRDNQDNFLYDRVQIMVATNAFGMGIDKSNVSFVAHYNMPKDIESYYQEAGRAGRDGEPADCLLLYSGQDVRTNMWMIENDRDAQYPDEQTEKLLKERSRERLREMTFYCTVNDCLRGYILKYFGERPLNFCGNCGSCDTNFETADVTVDAQKILSCVARMNQRFGLKMVIDVLRGAKSEKVRNFGFDKLSTYGISEKPERLLREIMNQLILTGYLLKTNDEYPVIKLGGRADEVLRGDESVIMKLVKEKEPKEAAKSKKKLSVKPVDKQLFAVLRDLRLAIAKEQNVPAFVIFPDSALTDMCVKTPVTKEGFLKVSGVGRVKLEKFGDRFLSVIAEFLDNNKDNNLNEAALAEVKEFDASSVEITEEPVPVSIVADRINCVLMENGFDKVSALLINEWLVSKGFMKVIAVENNRTFKIPTAAGANLGITSEERIIRGQNAKVNMYGKAAQEFITQNILEIMKFKHFRPNRNSVLQL